MTNNQQDDLLPVFKLAVILKIVKMLTNRKLMSITNVAQDENNEDNNGLQNLHASQVGAMLQQELR